MEEEQNSRDEILNELLMLSEAGEIKYKSKYLKKASNKTLERIQAEYKRQQLESVNKEVTEALIKKFSELMKSVANVRDVKGLKSDLLENGLLIDEIKRIIGGITPVIPFIGIIGAAVIVAKYVYQRLRSTFSGQTWKFEA